MLFMGASHATTQAIGGSVSAEIEISASLIEVSDPNSSQWLDFIAGRKTWRMTLGKLLILPDFYDGIKVGSKVVVQFGYSINPKEGMEPAKGFLGEEFDTKVEIVENGVRYFVDDHGMTVVYTLTKAE